MRRNGIERLRESGEGTKRGKKKMKREFERISRYIEEIMAERKKMQ